MARTAFDLPGPKGSFLMGSLPELQQDWLGTLRRWQARYGDFVVARLGPRPAAVIFNPEDAEAVLVENYKRVRKDFSSRRTRAVIGNGLLLSAGEFWLRQRRLIQPAFNRSRIALYAQTMAETAASALDRWEEGKRIDIHREL